jgi:hypothetical protein
MNAMTFDEYLDQARKCTEIVLEDESWQAAFTDDERTLWSNAAGAYFRHLAYSRRSPRAQLGRVLAMLRAASSF